MTESDIHRMGVLARRISFEEVALTNQLEMVLLELERLGMTTEERMRTLLFLAIAGCLSTAPELMKDNAVERIVRNFEIAATWTARDLASPAPPEQVH